MGLFNFLYKLTNIFSNKRKLKVFLILGLILLIAFSWSSGVFAASPTPEETNALTNYQLLLQESFANYLDYMITYNKINNSTSLNALFVYLQSQHIYVVPGTPSDTLNNRQVQYKVYVYTANNNDNNPNLFNIDGDWSIGLGSGTQYPCKLADFTGNLWVIYNFAYTDVQKPTERVSTSFYLPDACYLVRSTKINDLLIKNGYKTDVTSTYKTSDEELQAINRSGFQNLNNSINQQTQTMTNSITSATNSITNSVDNLTNTITDTTTDDEQVAFAEDSNQDLTTGFFTGLYNSFETAFTDNSYKYVQFPFPFTNKVITFSSTYVRDNIKNNQKFSVLVTLAEAFWWFALGYFVILDIYKKINAVKSGDLTNIENDNITTDLL